MKRQGILNAELAKVVAGLGHTDLLVIADAGFPVPPGVPCVDLAVLCNLPPMLDVTAAIADELEIEAVTVADELLARDSELPDALRRLFPGAALTHISHDDLKQLSGRARAVVRTGECTPYHNVVLRAGVVF